jgi:hypothetical protein
MNEERRQDYLNLIDALLSCPKGDEEQILKTNRDLVDAEFVGTMQQLTEVFFLKKYQKNANYLKSLVRQLKLYLSHNLLLKILQTIHNSKSDEYVVYQLLQDNLDKLDDTFPQLLQDWETAYLSDMKPDIAGLMIEFSRLIQEFRQGSKAINQEIAIEGYKLAAKVYTQEAFPEDWATIQNNLGNAYCNRIWGDRTENLEEAIRAYKNALLIRRVLPELG